MSETSSVIDFDSLSDDLGGFGRFQFFVYSLACLGSFFSGYFVVSPIFGSKVVPYRCKITGCDDETTKYDEDFLNYSVPWNAKDQTWDECQVYKQRELNQTDSFYSSTLINNINPTCIPLNFCLNKTVECDQWVYDTTLFQSTTNNQYSLYCDRAWLRPLESSFIMGGYFVGSLLMGMISDVLGRKLGIVISTFCLCIVGTLGIFAPNYYLFLATRLVAGVGCFGFYHIALIAAMEYLGPKWRTLLGILLAVPFALGEATLGLVAYFIRDWQYIYLANTLPIAIVFSYYWILPESVRWLWSKNRHNEALHIVRQIAKWNKRQLTLETQQQLLSQEEKSVDASDKEESLLDLLKSSVVRKRSLVLFYAWTICTLMYYGLSMYVGSLSGNIFINFTLVVMVEVPANITAAFIAKIFGCKLILIVSFILGGTSCIAAGFLNSDYNTAIVCLGLIGKFGITAAFTTIYLYSGEIYPTSHRAIGIGVCSMHGRIGGIIAPFIASLSQVYKPLPSLIFGVLSFLAGLLMFTLPETMYEKLPQTLKDSEDLGRYQTWLTVGKWFRSREKHMNELM